MKNLLIRSPENKSGGTYYFGDAFDQGEEWRHQQEESVNRYIDESYEADATLGELFGGFIAATVDKKKLVIDVGCGLHPLHPHYVKHLGLENFIGIEPLTTPTQRNYPCLAGVVAEDIPLKDGCAGAALFATSLDHIEDAPKAISEVLRVLEPGAPLYFWLGVHDPFILAEAKTFGNIHNHAKGWRKFLRIVAAPAEHLHLIIAMRRRVRNLREGIKLDNAHVRYHTTTGVDAEMASYGLTITRRLLVPGTASMFVEANQAE